MYNTYDYKDIVGLDCIVLHQALLPNGNVLNIGRGKNLTTNALVLLDIFTSSFENYLRLYSIVDAARFRILITLLNPSLEIIYLMQQVI